MTRHREVDALAATRSPADIGRREPELIGGLLRTLARGRA